MKKLYSEKEIKESCIKVKRLLPDSDAMDNNFSLQYFNAEISKDFTRKDLKRIAVNKSKFIKSKFNGAAATGSKFTKTKFAKCDFCGANFQYCYFINVSFTNDCLIKGLIAYLKIVHLFRLKSERILWKILQCVIVKSEMLIYHTLI